MGVQKGYLIDLSRFYRYEFVYAVSTYYCLGTIFDNMNISFHETFLYAPMHGQVIVDAAKTLLDIDHNEKFYIHHFHRLETIWAQPTSTK